MVTIGEVVSAVTSFLWCLSAMTVQGVVSAVLVLSGGAWNLGSGSLSTGLLKIGENMISFALFFLENAEFLCDKASESKLCLCLLLLLFTWNLKTMMRKQVSEVRSLGETGHGQHGVSQHIEERIMTFCYSWSQPYVWDFVRQIVNVIWQWDEVVEATC